MDIVLLCYKIEEKIARLLGRDPVKIKIKNTDIKEWLSDLNVESSLNYLRQNHI